MALELDTNDPGRLETDILQFPINARREFGASRAQGSSAPLHDIEVNLGSFGRTSSVRGPVDTPFYLELLKPTLMEPSAEAHPVLLPRERSEVGNRVLNLVVALLAIAVMAPFLLMIAICVKLSSPGPVFYIQSRVGMDRRRRRAAILPEERRKADMGGRIFRIIKFRSMRVDAESATGAVWAKENDPRITEIGRFLRKTRLDELPQLFNVVRGDMNVVGPRPERPSIFAELRQNIHGYPLRQRARPGITGWAQINQAYDSCLDDVRTKVQYDLEYLQRQSVVEDLRIMARTLPVMIFSKGAH